MTGPRLSSIHLGARAVAATAAVLVAACFPTLPPEEDPTEDGSTSADTADTAPDEGTAEVRPDSEETTSEGNLCGGQGELSPPLDSACGPCGDGRIVCDLDDPSGESTRCEGASAQNVCGGCGPLAVPIDAPCGECGTGACDPHGGPVSVCVEPAEGCASEVTCDDLGCAGLSRL